MNYIHITIVCTESTAISMCDNIGCDYEEVDAHTFNLLGTQKHKERYAMLYGYRDRLQFTVTSLVSKSR